MNTEKILTVAVHTLGCKVNQCDTDALLAKMSDMGFQTVPFSNHASIYIINTCTVTHVSDRKSRQMISRAKKNNPSAFVAVCGCMAKNKPDGISGVDFVFDARKPDDFFVKLKEIFTVKEYSDDVYTPKRTRAFVKIQDGCNRFCSYCIVPYVRGNLKSRNQTEILSEITELIQRGAMEIVLTGIQVASYGDDTKENNLAGLIRHTVKLDGLKRLRLSSIDPWAVDDDFLNAVAMSDILCGHFHLSLQSGCDTTLSQMNRRYTIEQYSKAAASLRNLRSDCALTTDIIVGFPGETDRDFEDSLNFVKEIGFAQVHVFEFSPREGTPAAGFNGQVPQKIKSERGIAMRELAAELRKNYLSSQVGRVLSVLFETDSRGYSTNYCTVEIKNNDDLTKTIQNVNITSCTETALTGQIKN